MTYSRTRLDHHRVPLRFVKWLDLSLRAHISRPKCGVFGLSRWEHVVAGHSFMRVRSFLRIRFSTVNAVILDPF